MKREQFDPGAPGRLLDLHDGVAFVPDQLPPRFGPSWDLIEAEGRARGALGEFMGRLRRSNNADIIIRPLWVREAVQSVQLEGTQATVQGVLFDVAGQPADELETQLDHLEAVRYLDALRLGFETIDDGRPLTLHLLRGLHEELLRGTRGADKRPGQFRKGQVAIGGPGATPGTARFVPPPPEEVSPLMEDLVAFLERPTFPPLVSAAIAHYQFEAIHPFEDGNGRLGRLLVTLFAVRHGIVDQPHLYLSEHFNAHRASYINGLLRVSTRASWEDWVLFFLGAIEAQATTAASRIERVLDLQTAYRDRILTLGARSNVPLATLDLVMERVVVTAPEVRDHVGCQYRPAQRALEALATLGIVEELANSYPRRWVARELMTTVYER